MTRGHVLVAALLAACSTRGTGSPRQPQTKDDACSPAPSQCIDQARASADESGAAAIARYSDVTTPLLAEMTREQAIAFTRATSAALDSQLPFGPAHECVGSTTEVSP